LLTVSFCAMLIGLEFRPGPVCDLVCEDGEDKDLAYRAGKRLVELRLSLLHAASQYQKEKIIEDGKAAKGLLTTGLGCFVA
jgi:hypothetical protein